MIMIISTVLHIPKINNSVFSLFSSTSAQSADILIYFITVSDVYCSVENTEIGWRRIIYLESRDVLIRPTFVVTVTTLLSQDFKL